ncbi:Clustered mitochondria protein [Glycine max]|nr:Clustered mitochondria protein [Glycine max]
MPTLCFQFPQFLLSSQLFSQFLFLLLFLAENRTRWRKRKRDSQISQRHQKQEEEEDDNDDENPNTEEDLAERDYDSEDQMHHNHLNLQPHVEKEILSDHDVHILQFLTVIKRFVNRHLSFVTTISVLPGILQGDKSDSLLYGFVDNGKKICWNEDFHSKVRDFDRNGLNLNASKREEL